MHVAIAGNLIPRSQAAGRAGPAHFRAPSQQSLQVLKHTELKDLNMGFALAAQVHNSWHFPHSFLAS